MSKLHIIKCMAFNLGLLMRHIIGSGKPRQLADGLRAVVLCLNARIRAVRASLSGSLRPLIAGWTHLAGICATTLTQPELVRSSTGC